jgi:hypothetical protein
MKILYGKIFYRPREIAELGLITNAKGGAGSISGHYDYILNLIHDGKLKARNYSRKATFKHYLVSEDEINRFNKEMAGL